MITPSSVISPKARIGKNVEIGPFCVIEDGVLIGDDCKLDAHVVIKSGVIVGNNNFFGSGAVVGGLPQHISAQPPFGNVVVGDNNTFRENITLHRSLKESGSTLIGNNNYLMVNAHVAHDCVIGNNNVLVNNTMLGGHVHVGNNVTFGGGTAVHQYCRIGSLAMLGGQSHIVQDIPPFMMVDGLTSRIVGLNLIGLRRNGRSTADIKTLKAAYLLLFRSDLTWHEILQAFDEQYSTGTAAELTHFIRNTQRGVVSERHHRRASLRLVEPTENDTNKTEESASVLRVNVG